MSKPNKAPELPIIATLEDNRVYYGVGEVPLVSSATADKLFELRSFGSFINSILSNEQVMSLVAAQDDKTLQFAKDYYESLSKKLKNNEENKVYAVPITATMEDNRVSYRLGEEIERISEETHYKLKLAQFMYFGEFVDSIQRNEQVMLAVVEENGFALQYASDELRGNKAIVLAAVQESGFALQFANEELKNNKEVVLAAVSKNGRALGAASEELKNNEEVVLAAVKQDGNAICFASEELRNNEEFLLKAIQRSCIVFKYVSDELKNNNDYAFVLAAFQQNMGIKDYLKYWQYRIISKLPTEELIGIYKRQKGEAAAETI